MSSPPTTTTNSNTVATGNMTCAFWYHKGYCTRGHACKYAHYHQQGMVIADLPHRNPTTGISLAGRNLVAARTAAQAKWDAEWDREQREWTQWQWEAHQYQYQQQHQVVTEVNRERRRMEVEYMEERDRQEREQERQQWTTWETQSPGWLRLQDDLWDDECQERHHVYQEAAASASASASTSFSSAHPNLFTNTSSTTSTRLIPHLFNPSLSVRQEVAQEILEDRRAGRPSSGDFWSRCCAVMLRRERMESNVDWIVRDG